MYQNTRKTQEYIINLKACKSEVTHTHTLEDILNINTYDNVIFNNIFPWGSVIKLPMGTDFPESLKPEENWIKNPTNGYDVYTFNRNTDEESNNVSSEPNI